MSTNCTYRFHTSEGQVTIQGMAAMKAFLATNGVGAIIKPPSKVKATARAAIEASAPAQARMSPARAPAFYSQLQRAIEQVPARLSTMAAPQWAQWLKANASKLGVKQDEITWSGIEDYLKLRGKDKIDSAELAAWVGANGVRVDETSLGDGGREYTYAEWAEANYPDTYKKLIEARESGDAESYHYLNRVLSRDWQAGLGRKRASDSAKYGDYTVPGGAKYRELLLTLPTGSLRERREALREFQSDMRQKYGDDWSENITPAERMMKNRLIADRDREPYRSSHWDDRDILAHVRVDERTGADGKRVLFVNELQSDWGQDGRKKGFKGEMVPGFQVQWNGRPIMTYETQEEADAHVARALSGDPSAPVSVAKVMAPKNDQHDAGKVPLAPFVTKTEGWLNLALKRIAMLAVEGGYDKVAFISGKQAADLYSLSNQIDRIDYNRNDDGNYAISAIKGGAEVFSRDDVSVSELEDIVGKEVAQKIVNGDGTPATADVDRWEAEDADEDDAVEVRSLSGLDLEVGGEGMKGFYDQIVPQAISKLLPRLGGEKLTKVGIPDGNAGREVVASQVPGEHMWGVYDRQMGQWLSSWDAETYASDPEDAEMMGEATAKSIASAIMRDAGVMLDQTGFEVTDKMRDTVLSGVPLFSRERAADAESDVDQTQDKYNQRIEALRELVACLTK